MKWYRISLAVMMLSVCFACIAEGIDRTEIEDTAKIRRIIDRKRRVEFIHPFLKQTYPVAIARNDSFHVYDAAERSGRYELVMIEQSPMPLRGTIRASFPLHFYGDKAACIVTPDVLDEDDVVITICHEFIHCGQWHNGELKVRAGLDITRRSTASDDPMWEIHYPFPYDDDIFVKIYSRFFEALKNKDTVEVRKCRISLKKQLDTEDYEYMVFMEWKEGLARYVENRVSRQLGQKEYRYGSEKPFNRISFYAGGAAYIEFLERKQPGIANDVIRLFNRMNEQP